MLAISFQLTTAQTKLLLAIAFEDYLPDSLMLPNYKRTTPQGDLVGVVHRLIARGLVTWHPDCPAYRATPLGFELATAIVKECRAAVELFDGLEKRRAANKPLIAKENAAKKAYRKSTGAPQ